jgi:hypothetical protein
MNLEAFMLNKRYQLGIKRKSIIPELRRLRQEDCKLKTSLGNTERHCTKIKF